MNVVEIQNFITPEDCAAIIQLASDKFQEAGVLGVNDGHRKAGGMWIDESLEFMGPLKDAIAEVTGLPRENQEHLHVIKYDVGGEFKAHHDYFHADTEYYEGCMLQGGHRLKTCLIYLNDNYSGGQTDFPELQLTVQPQTGKLIIWDDCKPDGSLNPESIHAGLPVLRGTKYVMSIWIRQHKFVTTAEDMIKGHY